MSDSSLTKISASLCHGGYVYKYEHDSIVLGCKMRFNIFLPPCFHLDTKTTVPVLYFLSGLTCNEDNMITKSGAIEHLANEGIALVTPDTSPRAGYYLDATTEKWKKHYNMYSYVSKELPELVYKNFPVDPQRASIFGHSMGGHGAIMVALRNPGMFKSVSAFAPMCHPSESVTSKNAFTEYLGPNPEDWVKYDSTELALNYQDHPISIFLDQGSEDNFLKEGNLHPDHFVSAVENSKKYIQLETRVHPGYDHGYWFIQTFIKDHIDFHAKFLKN
ncbi:hypothetical protein BB558_002735 [Smittium angustum]|uniref:S-formylglutathione hydrolase n=1 Tax=Smittium angustum TaxID=133377 RepID=A0A2U1J864_SMIAN|nr:hypothetical protein BB558_002735 [Smittium angustum]